MAKRKIKATRKILEIEYDMAMCTFQMPSIAFAFRDNEKDIEEDVLIHFKNIYGDMLLFDSMYGIDAKIYYINYGYDRSLRKLKPVEILFKRRSNI